MKKLMALLTFSLIFSLSFAQVQRQKKEMLKPGTDSSAATQKEDTGLTKREMMKELNLSKEQKQKLKDFRQAAQAKKEAIENDNTLKPEERETKLKELRKEQMKNTMSVLSQEQKMKLLQMRREKKGAKMDEIDSQ